jgi:catechol 2,3-dioxygenase-like lactoylglutathione lyase family enzyme
MGMNANSAIEQTNLHRIDHIAVVVDDVARAVEWYQQRFECTLMWMDETWAYFKFENCGLALVRPGQHPPHFAVELEQIECFGEPGWHRDGTRFVYVSDTDGNVVEILDRTMEKEA